jgi:aldose 1-epimerase
MLTIIKNQRSTKSWTTSSPAILSWFLLSTGCGAAGSEASPPARAPVAQETKSAEPKAQVQASAPAIEKEEFGEHGGKSVQLYTLRNESGLAIKAMTYGAIITEFHVPDAQGEFADIVQGFDTLDEYVAASPYFGATIGRLANRIKNAQFELDGKKYKLAANDGPNHLHGGKKGWDKVVWSAEAKESSDGPQIIYFTRWGGGLSRNG